MTTDLFDRRSFTTIVRDAHVRLGRDCTPDDLLAAVRKSITLDEYESWSEPAFRAAVLKAAKSRVSTAGADAVYEADGKVTALRLFSIEQFEQKARELASISRANFEAIRQLAAVCAEVHGRTFDAEQIISKVAA
jgi:hypothetical protein